MALPELDSSVGHSFGLEFDGVVIKQIVEVSGLKIDQDVVEFKQHTDRGKFIGKKLPGRPKAGEVTLTRGLTQDTSFGDWIRDSQFGKVPDARKGGAIIVFDYEGTAIKRYNLLNARPKKLEVGKLEAGDTVVLAEKLTLTYRGCEASET
jgi:phage tail-like protein